MSDIVERLRACLRFDEPKWSNCESEIELAARDAADEIERLNAELDNHALLVEKLERQDAEIERLRAELAAEKDEVFRLQESHSRVYAELGADAIEAREAELERLRAENFSLAAGQCVNSVGDEGGTPVCKELAAVKALLRDADKIVEVHSRWFVGPHGDLHKRIRAALGDEPADDAPRKQP